MRLSSLSQQSLESVPWGLLRSWYCILEISTMKSGYSICLVGSYAVLDAESSDGRADIVIRISMHSTYNYLHGLRLYSLQDP